MSQQSSASTPQREIRYLSAASASLEVRATQDGQGSKISGYAALFAPTRSQDLGGFVEEIAPSAFDSALSANADVRGLFNHDPNFVFGRTKSGTLSLSVDKKGLRYQAQAPATQWASDLVITMRRGDIDGSSYGFVCTRDDWRVDPDGTVVRTLLDLELLDVSVVTYPATLATSSQARAQFGQKIAEVRSAAASSKRDDDDDDDDDCDPETDIDCPDDDEDRSQCGCCVARVPS